MQVHAQVAPPDALSTADSTTGVTNGVPADASSGSNIPADAAAPTRALRILGLTKHGDRVVCVETHPSDPATSARAAGIAAAAHTDTDPAEPRFTLAIDERLRAAVRGDLGSAAEGEIDMTPGLRPREIQSRIRAGASVDQVAAAAGCPAERIEGYAYPVLLERTTIAERARAAQPLKGAGGTLEEIVTGTLTDRGQQGDIEWDAFKDERGWTVTLTWQAGRSENRAEWSFSSRPGGGTVTARNTEATDLLEPGRAQLRPVDQVRTRYDAFPGETLVAHGTAPGHERDQTTATTVPNSHDTSVHPDHSTTHDPTVPDTAALDTAPATAGASYESDAASPKAGATAAPSARTARRGHRPPMPSWEDVLLGTRTAEH